MADWEKFARKQAKRATDVSFEEDITVAEGEVPEITFDLIVKSREDGQWEPVTENRRGLGISVFYGNNGINEALIAATRSCCEQLDMEVLGIGRHKMAWALVYRDADFNRSRRIAEALKSYFCGLLDVAEAKFAAFGIDSEKFGNDDD